MSSLFPKASYAQDLAVTSPSVGPIILPTPRAIGSEEYKCHFEGNCLQVGEFDGAVRWNWGGKDQCDANDPCCGANGILHDSDTPLVGQPVPQLPTRDDHDAVIVTQIVAIYSMWDARENQVCSNWHCMARNFQRLSSNSLICVQHRVSPP